MMTKHPDPAYSWLLDEGVTREVTESLVTNGIAVARESIEKREYERAHCTEDGLCTAIVRAAAAGQDVGEAARLLCALLDTEFPRWEP